MSELFCDIVIQVLSPSPMQLKCVPNPIPLTTSFTTFENDSLASLEIIDVSQSVAFAILPLLAKPLEALSSKLRARKAKMAACCAFLTLPV
jgi:hypothetical protein